MKQGQPTFADRARAIMAKYSKFKDDPISIKSMDRELEILAQEQEELKAAQEAQQAQMQQGQMPQQGMPQEGQPQQMWRGGTYDGTEVPGIVPNNNMMWNTPQPNTPFGNYPAVSPYGTPSAEQGNVLGVTDTQGFQDDLNRATVPNYGMFSPKSSQQGGMPKGNSVGGMGSIGQNMVDYKKLIGQANAAKVPAKTGVEIDPEDAKFNMMGAAGAAGNVFQLIDDLRNPADVEDYGRVDPSLVDSTIQESNARNAINTSINNVVGASDETSQTSGQRLSRRAGLESARRDKVGRALGQIREQTDNTNAQIQNRTAEFNKGIDIREANDNSQNASARKARIASNLNQIGANVLAKPKAEQNANQVVNNQNARLINMINSGYFSDYTMSEMLKIVARKPTEKTT